nr:oxoglutarate/iron-dependent dioxygenase [Tanacetum cinerariifolium]
MQPDICIVSFYKTDDGLGLHQDRDESSDSLDKGLPMVSISIGDSAQFSYGHRKDATKEVSLNSGDVLIFGGDSRHIYHGVTITWENTSFVARKKHAETRPSQPYIQTILIKPRPPMSICLKAQNILFVSISSLVTVKRGNPGTMTGSPSDFASNKCLWNKDTTDSSVQSKKPSVTIKVTGVFNDWTAFSKSGCMSFVEDPKGKKRDIEGSLSMLSTPGGTPGMFFGKGSEMMEVDVSKSEVEM